MQTLVEAKRRLNLGANIYSKTGFHRASPLGDGCSLYLPGLPGTGATIYDFSGEGNHGTIDGATWTRLPSGLWYLDCDGLDDYIGLGTDTWADADFATGITLAGWAYADTVNGTNQRFIDIETKHSVYIEATTDLLVYEVYDGASKFAKSNGAISTSTYYFVVATWDGTTMTLYVDTVAQTTTGTASAVNLDGSVRPSAIGAFRTGASEFLDGRWILPRVINNKAWSQKYITHIFNQERHLLEV